LQQIVWNILSNAIKFTPRGGRVEVCLEQSGRDACIKVSDSGAGINQEFLPHVFDRFRQADSSYTRRHSGLGLGLAIVRHLVEMHGGTAQAYSDGEGQGATFIVSLPLLKAEGGRRKAEGQESTLHPSLLISHPLLSGLFALVVDDEPDARELIKLTLEQHGARVTTAASVAEAIAALEELSNGRQPDVIVSDIVMPNEDGLSLIGRVRAMESETDFSIPAIALTAYARAEDRERSLAAGFQMHMVKPFNPSELVDAVASVIRRTRSVNR
jgi:CheY-like chemotaxis protein